MLRDFYFLPYSFGYFSFFLFYFCICYTKSLKFEERKGGKEKESKGSRQGEKERRGEGGKKGKEGADGGRQGGRKSRVNAVASTSQLRHQLSQVRGRETWVPSCQMSPQSFRGASADLILGSHPRAGVLRGLMKP